MHSIQRKSEVTKPRFYPKDFFPPYIKGETHIPSPSGVGIDRTLKRINTNPNKYISYQAMHACHYQNTYPQQQYSTSKRAYIY